MKTHSIETALQVAIIILLALSLYLIIACTTKRRLITPGHTPSMQAVDNDRFAGETIKEYEIPLTR